LLESLLVGVDHVVFLALEILEVDLRVDVHALGLEIKDFHLLDKSIIDVEIRDVFLKFIGAHLSEVKHAVYLMVQQLAG